MKVATIFVALACVSCFLSTVESWRRRRRRRCYRNCTPGNWGRWSTCTRSCSRGTQVRTRGISVAAACGGSCNYKLSETRYCNTQCCRVNCAWSWNSWSPCNGCGMSTKTRTMSITRYPSCRGTSCPSQRSQTISCNTGMWVILKKLHLKTFQFRRRAFGIEVHSLLEVPCCFGNINLMSVSSILMFLTVDNSTCSLSLTFFVTLNNFQILFLESKPNE